MASPSRRRNSALPARPLTGFDAADCTINTFGSNIFPGITITWPGTILPSYQPLLNIGAGALSLAAFTGVFQNRFNPSANAIWTLGKHTITFGGSFAYTQLNTRDRRNQLGTIEAQVINQFLQGELNQRLSVYAGTQYLTEIPIATGEPMKPANTFRINFSCARISPSPRACVSIGTEA